MANINTTFGSYASDGYQTINDGAPVVASDVVNKYDITLAANTANTSVPVSFLYTKLQYYWALASGGDATLKFNSAGSPNPSIALVSGQPRRWLTSSGETNPFINTTALYVDSTAGCRLYLWFGVNK